MKNRFLSTILALGGACLGHEAAAAPASVAGFVYYESGGTAARTELQQGIILNANGTYRGLFIAGSSLPGEPVTFTTVNPEDGTFVYSKVDENHAELTLTNSTDTANSSSGFSGKRHLTFTSAAGGGATIDNNLSFFNPTFRLVSSAGGAR